MMQPIRSTVADHGYRCPKCEAPMVTFQRSSVTVERCSECRGIFLDRGELERLLDMEAGPMHAREPRHDGWAGRPDRRWDDDDDLDDRDDDEDDRWRRRRGRRRGGLFEDLLDVFGD